MKPKRAKPKYYKCPVCGLYTLGHTWNANLFCPRCVNGWRQPEDFGWKKLGDFEQCNYWIVNVNIFPGSDDMWGWTATTWLKEGESLQIKKLNFKSNAGCKASWTLFAKKHSINHFEFED